VLFCYSEFGLIAGAGAVSTGILTENVLVMVALLVATSFVVLGVANKWMSDIYDRFFAFLDKESPAKKRTDHLPSSIGKTQYLVVGMGTCGTSTYDYLKEQKLSVMGVDADPNVIIDHRKKGRRVIYGNAVDKSFWSQCSLMKIKGISICLPVTDEKIVVVKKLRKLGFKNKIDSYCYFDDDAEKLINAGVSELVSPLKVTGMSLGKIVTDTKNNDG
jgi:hypothetical protein